MTRIVPFFPVSTCVFPLVTIPHFPFLYTSLILVESYMNHPVGKSGPLMISIISSIDTSYVVFTSGRSNGNPSSTTSPTFQLFNFSTFQLFFKGFPSFSNNNRHASNTSFKLCGAIFVAIPTAIPIVPLQR